MEMAKEMREFTRYKDSMLVDEYAAAGLTSPIEGKQQLQKAIAATGGRFIDLSIMTDQTPPEAVRKAAADAAMKGGYDKNLLSTRTRLCEHFRTRYGVTFDPADEVFLTAGGQTALDNAFKLLVEPGDEVIIFEPEYATYEPMVRFYGGHAKAHPLRLEDGKWSLAVDELAAKVSSKTRLIAFSSPNNPSGYVFGRDELAAIAALAKKHDLWVLSDETWAMMLLDPQAEFVSAGVLQEIRDRLVVIYSASKTFGMSGYRMGAALGPADFMQAFDAATRFSCHAAPTIGQHALEKALDPSVTGEWVQRRVDNLRRRAAATVPRFRELGVPCAVPRSGVFLFPDISGTGLTSMQFSLDLLADKGVFVFPGFFYGRHTDRHVRISMAVPDASYDKGMDALLDFIRSKTVAAA